MNATTDAELIDAVRFAARPLSGAADDDDALLELIGDAHFVLLGEASHGTHEFYRERARITQRLVAEKGFNAVAIERGGLVSAMPASTGSERTVKSTV